MNRILGTLALSLLSLPAVAQADPTDASNACAAEIAAQGQRAGYTVLGVTTGQLRRAHSATYTVALEAHRDHVIYACGDASTKDMDLHLFDQNGTLVGLDIALDALPVVEVTPAWTGPFRVEVEMFKARRRATYTLVVLGRDEGTEAARLNS